MSLLRGIVKLFILKLVLIQLVSSEVIVHKLDENTYEYDNESEPLGIGSRSTVYKGIRKHGNETEVVAVKTSTSAQWNFTDLQRERDVYEALGSHDSIPKVYHYSPQTEESKEILVTELLGDDLNTIYGKLGPFSTATVMKIGLQMLDILESIHKKGIVHCDVFFGNYAVGSKDDSKLYLFDFGAGFICGSPGCSAYGDRVNVRNEMMTFVTTLYTHTPEENRIAGEMSVKEAMNEYLFTRMSGPVGYYEKLRNVFKTELEKHKNESNYDKFDWQK